MATREDVTVRLGLDKSGFDSGLSGAAKTLKGFAKFFGIATSAVFLKRIIGDVGELASEVSKLREESISARDVFDKMASGIEVVGDVAGVTAEQMEKLKEAAKLFTPEDLDGLAKGASAWGKIKDLTKQAVGKTAAFGVNFMSSLFGMTSSKLADMVVGGGSTVEFMGRGVASDREVAKALREERERLKVLEEQKENRDWQKQMLAEEEYAIEQLRVKEEDRLNIEREKLNLKIQSLEKDQAAARLSRQQSLSDRSGFSVAELAAMDQSHELFSAAAIPSILKARSIELMEKKARFARLSGNTGLANVISQEALNMRGELAPLTGAEGSPLPKLDEIKSELAALRELATGQGLIIQPRMSK